METKLLRFAPSASFSTSGGQLLPKHESCPAIFRAHEAWTSDTAVELHVKVFLETFLFLLKLGLDIYHGCACSSRLKVAYTYMISNYLLSMPGLNL